MATWQETPCHWVDQRLEEWLGGDLPPADAKTLECHLASCPRCAGAATQAREIAAELQALPALDAPPRVLDAVREQASRRRWYPWDRPGTFLPLAATLMVIVGLVFMLRPGGQEPGPDPEAVARATAEARFALAYVGSITQRTGESLRQDQLEPWVLTPLAAVLAPPADEATEDHRLKES